MLGYYILDENREPKKADTADQWYKWFALADRNIKRDDVGTSFISTVFLGMDHSLPGGLSPLLYETMIFSDDEHDGEQWRASTEKEALENHATALSLVRN